MLFELNSSKIRVTNFTDFTYLRNFLITQSAFSKIKLFALYINFNRESLLKYYNEIVSNFSLNVVAAKHNNEQASSDTADRKSFNFFLKKKFMTK